MMEEVAAQLMTHRHTLNRADKNIEINELRCEFDKRLESMGISQ